MIGTFKKVRKYGRKNGKIQTKYEDSELDALYGQLKEVRDKLDAKRTELTKLYRDLDEKRKNAYLKVINADKKATADGSQESKDAYREAYEAFSEINDQVDTLEGVLEIIEVNLY